MYSTTQKLWEIGSKKRWESADEKGKKWDASFVEWKFKDDSTKDSDLASATGINVEFWSGYNDYSVGWKYDGTCGCYKRENGGAPHKDLNTNQQLDAKNVVVQFETESRANDGYENNAHMLYKTTGQGKALFFQDGKVVEGKWIKSARLSRTKYVDSAGKEISFNRGAIWIQTVPVGAKVSY